MARRSTEDEKLGKGAEAGKQTEEYRPLLHRFLRRLLGNSQDAHDLAQEAYMRFYQLPKADAVQRPKAYLFRVASNLVYEFRLRKRREKEVLTFDSELFEVQAEKAVDGTNRDPSEELESAQLLNRVLMQIPPGYRKVLVMYKRDGLTAAQIAEKLDLSKRSVEIYIARAMTYARRAKWK